MKVLKIMNFSGLELTKVQKGKETMAYGDFSLGKMSVEKLLGQIAVRIEHGGGLTRNTV